MPKKNILIIAPHPDDETLGCGGTIFKHKKKGDNVFLVIITSVKTITDSNGNINKFYKNSITQNRENQKIKKFYNFKKIFYLNFPTTRLDVIPFGDIAKSIDNTIKEVKPEVVYLPSIFDSHTDHYVTVKATLNCIKWFRNNSIKRVLGYEVLSETNFNYLEGVFKPNVYIDISSFLQKKINAMKIYKTELKKHPFPRSPESIKSLAILRGSESGVKAAEAFHLYIDRSDKI
ncbi:MAG: PIG-L family deacetylase [Pelagibacterales bacterium]|nr:PIG-L family deacetylase [Pelagibacterales bacterium]